MKQKTLKKGLSLKEYISKPGNNKKYWRVNYKGRQKIKLSAFVVSMFLIWTWQVASIPSGIRRLLIYNPYIIINNWYIY